MLFGSHDGSRCCDRLVSTDTSLLRRQIGWTSLHISAYTGCWDLVQLLLEHGADVGAVDQASPAPHAPRSRVTSSAAPRQRAVF